MKSQVLFSGEEKYFSMLSAKNFYPECCALAKPCCFSYFYMKTHVLVLIRGTSNEYQKHMFLWRNRKNIYLEAHLI